MGRPRGLCRRCGGPKRGRAARPALPIAQCYACGDDICERHARWLDDGYICTKCALKIGLKEYGTAQKRILPRTQEMPHEHPDAGGTGALYQPGDPD